MSEHTKKVAQKGHLQDTEKSEKQLPIELLL